MTKSYICKGCGFTYASKSWAEKCRAWCEKNKSCNLEITRHALGSKN